MKKTFRFLGMMLCIMLTTVCFSSCSDDDKDDNKSSIVGKWKYVDEEDDDYTAVVTFKSDGTFIWTDIEYGEKSTGTGTYTYNDKVLKISWDDYPYEEPEVCTATIKGDRLTLYWDDGDTVVFVRM